VTPSLAYAFALLFFIRLSSLPPLPLFPYTTLFRSGNAGLGFRTGIPFLVQRRRCHRPSSRALATRCRHTICRGHVHCTDAIGHPATDRSQHLVRPSLTSR